MKNDWENGYVGFDDENKFFELYGFGFTLYVTSRNNEKKYSRCIYGSEFENYVNLIIPDESAKTAKIQITDPVRLVLNVNYLALYWCTKTDDCIYSTNLKCNIEKHEKICTGKTKMWYRQKTYGSDQNTKTELQNMGVIPLNDTNMQKFITFDIECVNCPKEENIGNNTVIYAKQEIVSVAITSNLAASTDDYIFIRDDMTTSSEKTLITDFLQKLTEMSNDYYRKLPSSVTDYFESCKILIQDKECYHCKKIIVDHSDSNDK